MTQDPVVPLTDICTKYLNLSAKKAMEKAALNQLPFPTFRLADSQRAPLLVSVTDLMAHIEVCRAAANESWAKSQV